MRIFDKLSNLLGPSGRSASQTSFDGKIEEMGDLDAVEIQSGTRMQVIYKHSNRCPLCHMAMRQVRDAIEKAGKQADFYLLDVIASRPVSMAAAERWGIHHESPQVLLIDDGNVAWHVAHRGVKADAIINQLGFEMV